MPRSLTWAVVGAQLASRRVAWEPQSGGASSQALVRPFGTDQSTIRVTLYRDNHAWCPYCHKVWLYLEEKRIPYRVVKINMFCYGKKQSWFTKLVPSGMLPAMNLDGRLVTESDVILRQLEDAFPEPRMLPTAGSTHREVADRFLKLERTLFSRWLRWLTTAGNDAENRSAYELVLTDIDESIESTTKGPLFLGANVSLVDCVYAPFLERQAASLLYYKGLRIKGGRWPRINAWFTAMEKRETYRGTMSDFHTHVHDLPPQLGGCKRNGTPEQVAAAAAIDGTDGVAWRRPLPSPFAVDAVEPLLASEAWPHDPAQPRHEACAALVRHAGKVCALALRASRNATKSVHECVDLALCIVASRLLNDGEEPEPKIAGKIAIDAEAAGHVAAGLRYVRDRVNVPRDMSYLAALELRAELNRVADSIDPVMEHAIIPLAERDRYDQDADVFHRADSAL